MFISIIVPFHNAGLYLDRCIAALLAQRYPRDQYEIILVDNNSTDGSSAQVQRYDTTRLLRESKPGAYAARNCGIRAARGAVLAFTDPDCIPQDNWLTQIAYAFTDPTVHVTLGYRLPGKASLALRLLSDYENTKDAYVLRSQCKEMYYGYTNNMAVRATVFARIGPFMEVLRGGDTVFVRRVVDHFSCDAVKYIPAMVIRHLELDSVSTYYKKLFFYGLHRRANNAIAPFARPLNRQERWAIFRETIRERCYSSLEVVVFASLLSGGLAAWNSGYILHPYWASLTLRKGRLSQQTS